MSQAGSRVRVQCTFPGCPRFFSSEKEMKKHKTVDPEHEYCNRCDEDFEDENRLLIHKIKSEKHIACPLCGLDFRSEGGRDTHVRQYHRADQNMVCVGCGVKYTRAAGLMAHVEDGECPVITPKRLLQEQAKKLIVSAALKSGTGSPMIVNPSDPDGIGGVRVDEALNREAFGNQPKPDVNNDDNKSKSSWKPSAPPSTVSLKHWPRLGDVTPSKPDPDDLMEFSRLSLNLDDRDPEPSDLMAFSKLSINDRKPDQKLVDKHWPKLGTQPAPSDLMEFSRLSVNDPPEADNSNNKVDRGKGKAKAEDDDAESNARDPRLPWEVERTEAKAPSRQSGDGFSFAFGRLPDTGEIIKAFVPYWDPTRYFNSFTGFYDCPCGVNFKNMKDFEEHIMEKARHKQYFRCPACHRVFKSGAALVAHCESATTRCNISESEDYAKIIDELTGGIIQYAGYNKDGTARYEAGKIIELPDKKDKENTTIGPDLDKMPKLLKEQNTSW